MPTGILIDFTLSNASRFYPLGVKGLKAYAMNDEQLKKLLDIVNIFSTDIKMEFGLDKCAKATFIKGKLTKISNIVLNQDAAI